MCLILSAFRVCMLLKDHIRPRNRPLLASFRSARCNYFA
jgi:hypothetical protein